MHLMLEEPMKRVPPPPMTPRHRRRRLYLPKEHKDAFVQMSIDVPRWLWERLEEDASAMRLSRAAIASEWLELHAIATEPKRKRR